MVFIIVFWLQMGIERFALFHLRVSLCFIDRVENPYVDHVIWCCIRIKGEVSRK